jgi:hypothetical protein
VFIGLAVHVVIQCAGSAAFWAEASLAVMATATASRLVHIAFMSCLLYRDASRV